VFVETESVMAVAVKNAVQSGRNLTLLNPKYGARSFSENAGKFVPQQTVLQNHVG
jgi:hypothetical protein